MDGKELAKFIDEELDARGLKKKSFYEATGISSATLSQWRVGRYNPSEDNLVAVERFFGVQFLTFVDLDAENKKSPETEVSELDSDSIKILELIHQLTPENSVRAIAYIQGLVDTQ